MADYVQLDGVRTWYKEYGDGEPLVALHPGGAGVDSRAWAPNLGALSTHFHVYVPDRRGHGRTPDVEGPITFDAMAQDTIAFLETVVGRPAHVVGCSDGATVALLVALRRPELISRLVLVAGVFHFDGWASGVIDPDAEPPEFLERLYGEVSPDRSRALSGDRRQAVPDANRRATLTANDLRAVKNRTLVMVADDDEVTLEHPVEMYRPLNDGDLMVVPGTSHGLLVEKTALCNSAIIEFLTTEPVPTMAPIRRADRSRA